MQLLSAELLLLHNIRLSVVLDCVHTQEAVLANRHVSNALIALIVIARVNTTAVNAAGHRGLAAHRRVVLGQLSFVCGCSWPVAVVGGDLNSGEVLSSWAVLIELVVAVEVGVGVVVVVSVVGAGVVNDFGR